ncbi:PAS domain-containing protein [Sorangium cellulosum]|uniref:Anti-anti-sigma factor n=2 Tax=Sorangium cellulosum TaxID=56 RepID=A0A150QI28_SORCE|nr:PAS domain-containing protein [Sorangium cellulosum]KYF67655.1 anti-anti-sigma factor [Sorangium cellulosum]
MVRDELGETEAVRLRAENAALRARVEALEEALAGRSDGRAPDQDDGAARGAPDGGAPRRTLDGAAPLRLPDGAAQEGAAPGEGAHGAPEWLPTAMPAVIHWRADGTVTRWNEGSERIFGWSASEAVGRKLADLVAADPVSPAAVQAFAFAHAESRFASAASEARTKDGHALSCRWTYAVLRDERGDVREIAAIVDEMSDRRRREQTVHGRYQMLLQLVDNARSSIFVKDIAGRYVFANRAYAQSLQKHVIELIGTGDVESDIIPPEVAALLAAKEREVIAGGQVMQFEEVLPAVDAPLHFFTVKFPIHDERGEPIGLGGIVTEITSLRRAEAERTALQEKIIAAQQAALRELSTPLIPLADRVVAMPLVGAIDGARAELIMETLLAGISSQRAHTAILDITGVRAVDTLVANALTRTARAAQLLGTRVVLTGVRPEVAQTLVTLGVDLAGITTLSTLQSGIAYALRHAGQ